MRQILITRLLMPLTAATYINPVTQNTAVHLVSPYMSFLPHNTLLRFAMRLLAAPLKVILYLTCSGAAHLCAVLNRLLLMGGASWLQANGRRLMEADVGFSKRGSSEAWPSAAWYVRGMGRCANFACRSG